MSRINASRSMSRRVSAESESSRACALQTLRERVVTATALACLVSTFILMPVGVKTVRAEAGDEANMSVDPKLEAELEKKKAPAKVAPVVDINDKEAVQRPGIAGVETAPGVIVLNTRGYNYGPRPGALDPAALTFEGKTQ